MGPTFPERRRARLLVAVADALDAEAEQLAGLAGTGPASRTPSSPAR
ncbi:hypothetical protein HBB16_15465 [Pseudonocardia sp. MCCB 268]|nr:hypothetical protein [Pseudonocardia cytotoxica]